MGKKIDEIIWHSDKRSARHEEKNLIQFRHLSKILRYGIIGGIIYLAALILGISFVIVRFFGL